MLSFWDEDPEWLYRSVKSAGKVCDTLLALDGPYTLFPGATQKPRSSRAEVDAIDQAGLDAGMLVRVLRMGVWYDGEVGKRTYLLNWAALAGGDWLFRIDADEEVLYAPDDLGSTLAVTPHHVAATTFYYWHLESGGWLSAPLRVLFRRLPAMWVAGHHARIMALDDRGKLVKMYEPDADRDDCPQAPVRVIPGFTMKHYAQDRNPERQATKDEYYARMRCVEQ